MFPVSCVGAALVVCVRSDALRLTFASHTVSFHSSLHGLRLESSLWLTLMCCSRGRKPFTSQTVSLNMHYISFQMFFSTRPYHLGYCCYTTAKLPIVRHAHCDVLVSVLNNVDIKADSPECDAVFHIHWIYWHQWHRSEGWGFTDLQTAHYLWTSVFPTVTEYK